MTTTDWLFTGIGVVGACILLFGFYRINIGKWTSKSVWYELDNFIGALLIIVYQIHYHTYVTVVVNAVWALVALWGLAMFFVRARRHGKRKRA